jgi:hypothetical protein
MSGLDAIVLLGDVRNDEVDGLAAFFTDAGCWIVGGSMLSRMAMRY